MYIKSHCLVVGTVAMLMWSAATIAKSAVARSAEDDAPSVTVPYHDLDLASERGVVTLYARIRAAATTVCKSSEYAQLLGRPVWFEWNSCVNHAVARAVRAVHNDKLSAYHWSQIRGWKHDTSRLAATRSAIELAQAA